MTTTTRRCECGHVSGAHYGREGRCRGDGCGCVLWRPLRVTVPEDDHETEARLAAFDLMREALRDARPILEALQAAHPLPDHDSAAGHGHALRVVRAALAAADKAARGES